MYWYLLVNNIESLRKEGVYAHSGNESFMAGCWGTRETRSESRDCDDSQRLRDVEPLQIVW